MKDQQHISSVSRRGFLSTGFKVTALSAFLLPFEKVLANGTAIIKTAGKKLQQFLPLDKLVLNTKTRVVHLASGRLFSKYPTIKRRAIIGDTNWEMEVRPPYHFNKQKSGIILETLALTRLSMGVSDRTLTDAYRILSIAFTGTYKDKAGIVLNKYNFRLHNLLLHVIALNTTFPANQKWTKFQTATANINYNLDTKPLPRFMQWMKTKADFDKKVNYILENKSTYSSRLAKRASRHKL